MRGEAGVQVFFEPLPRPPPGTLTNPVPSSTRTCASRASNCSQRVVRQRVSSWSRRFHARQPAGRGPEWRARRCDGAGVIGAGAPGGTRRGRSPLGALWASRNGLGLRSCHGQRAFARRNSNAPNDGRLSLGHAWAGRAHSASGTTETRLLDVAASGHYCEHKPEPGGVPRRLAANGGDGHDRSPCEVAGKEPSVRGATPQLGKADAHVVSYRFDGRVGRRWEGAERVTTRRRSRRATRLVAALASRG
jgi:hypothetical protein